MTIRFSSARFAFFPPSLSSFHDHFRLSGGDNNLYPVPGRLAMRSYVLLAALGYLCLYSVLIRAEEPDTAQEKALAAIKKAGGIIKRDDSSPATPVIGVRFGCQSSVTDADLTHLKNFPDVQELLIVGQSITDEGLAALKTLSRLRSLTVIHAGITDKGLDHLKQMQNLRRVYFRFTQVSQAGAEELAKALPHATVTWKP
jgi:hypothetical protein